MDVCSTLHTSSPTNGPRLTWETSKQTTTDVADEFYQVRDNGK